MVAELYTLLVDISMISQPELEFYSYRFGSGIGKLHVDINNNGIVINDVLVLNGSFQTNSSSAWQKYNISLSNYSGIVQVRFRSFSGNTGLNNSVALDDISFKGQSFCNNPSTNIIVSNLSSDSFSLGWTENSGATSLEIEFVPQSSNFIGLGVITNTNPIVFSNLMSNSCYKLAIRSKCSNRFSPWAYLQNVCIQENFCRGYIFYY